jgi:hypothetical protein
MSLLFAISLLSFLTLIAASVVIARHVRSSRNSTPRKQTFAQHLQAAASDRDFRQPRTLQLRTVRDVLAAKNWNQHQAQLSEALDPLSAMPKHPQASHDRQWRRIDRTYFNEELGDLTEPEPPRIQANARNSSRFSKGY